MPYSWLLLLVLGLCLAGAIGTVVVTGRLFLLRSEALISAMALIAFFFLGFAGPFLPHSARWFLAVAGFILFVSTVHLYWVHRKDSMVSRRHGCRLFPSRFVRPAHRDLRRTLDRVERTDYAGWRTKQ